MPATIEALIIIVVLVTPGFVCARLLTSDIPQPFVSQAHSLVLALIFSVLIHLVLLPLSIWLATDISTFSKQIGRIGSGVKPEMNWSVFVWLVSVVFLAPFFVAWILSAIWKSDWTQPALRRFGLAVVQLTPQAWDWFFLTQSRGCWVVAELDDGSLVGGEYGRDSFASLSPRPPDLFLESRYDVDEEHQFGDRIPNNVGVWINGGKVTKLHFYRLEEEEN